MRLAFVSPLPPAPTGIADYAADVLGLLAGRHEIDAFHDQEEVDPSRLPPSCSLHRAATLLERNAARPYDLVIYQMGNGRTHDHVYDLLPRLPGMLVLHDLVLHHSRAGMFLDSPEARAYARDPSSARLRQAAMGPFRAYAEELAYAYPAQAGRLDQAFLETVGDLLPYAFPLFRIPVEAARLVAVHNGFMAEAIRAEAPAPVGRAALHFKCGGFGRRPTAEHEGGQARDGGGAEQAEEQATIIAHRDCHIRWAETCLLPRRHRHHAHSL